MMKTILATAALSSLGGPMSVRTRDDGAIFVIHDSGDILWLVRHGS